MNTTERLLALAVFFLALINGQLVGNDPNELFQFISVWATQLTVILLPLYLGGATVRQYLSETGASERDDVGG